MKSAVSRMVRTSLLCGALSVLGVLAARPAHAQGVQAEVLIVLAKEQPGEIDPALRDVPALRRPPFNAFRSMQILARPHVRLTVNSPVDVNLPNGRRLQLTLKQVTPDGRFRVSVAINRPNQADYLPLLQVVASPGDPFFVAGQSHDGGTLVVGIRVGERPTRPQPRR